MKDIGIIQALLLFTLVVNAKRSSLEMRSIFSNSIDYMVHDNDRIRTNAIKNTNRRSLNISIMIMINF